MYIYLSLSFYYWPVTKTDRHFVECSGIMDFFLDGQVPSSSARTGFYSRPGTSPSPACWVECNRTMLESLQDWSCATQSGPNQSRRFRVHDAANSCLCLRSQDWRHETTESKFNVFMLKLPTFSSLTYLHNYIFRWTLETTMRSLRRYMTCTVPRTWK